MKLSSERTMRPLPGGLELFDVNVSHGRVLVDTFTVAAHDRAHASALAIGRSRANHNWPTSVQLFAEVVG